MLRAMDLGRVDVEIGKSSVRRAARPGKNWPPALGMLFGMGVSGLLWLVGGGLVWLAWGRMNHIVGAVLAWVTGFAPVS
jgi:hypothetical protein